MTTPEPVYILGAGMHPWGKWGRDFTEYGVVAARAPKKLLQMAGVKDVYTSSSGQTATMGNFLKATFSAVTKTYGVLTPELWAPTYFTAVPFDEFSDFLSRPVKAKRVQQDERR